jgi:iron(III) transport system ATP-binding protein
MFEVRAVVRRFPGRPEPVWALRGVDLDAPDGGITALLGPSGSGKSTLLRILAGSDRPDSGEVRLDGRLVAGPGTFVRPEDRNVGIVTQEGSLFPHLDVAANITFGLTGGWRPGRRRNAHHRRASELLELVGLPGYEHRRPDELSGGEQQRVALARALAPNPSVLLLDEPFSALDAALRADLREEVCDLLRQLGTTAVLVTHDQGEALSLADHVVILRDGRAVQAGPPAALYARPADADTASLLGDVILIPGVARAGVTGTTCVDCAFGVLDAEATAEICDGGGSCLVVLRPEQLRLHGPGVRAKVISSHFYGHDGMVRLEVPGIDGPVAVRTVGELPEPGCEVEVQVAAGAVAHTVAVRS